MFQGSIYITIVFFITRIMNKFREPLTHGVTGIIWRLVALLHKCHMCLSQVCLLWQYTRAPLETSHLAALFSHEEDVNRKAADLSKINIRRGGIHDQGHI